MDLECFHGSSIFSIGDFVAGDGLAVGLLLRRQGGCASSSSGVSTMMRLEIAPLPLLVRLLTFFQRSTSILADGLRRWLLQLNQDLESADEVLELWVLEFNRVKKGRR